MTRNATQRNGTAIWPCTEREQGNLVMYRVRPSHSTVSRRTFHSTCGFQALKSHENTGKGEVSVNSAVAQHNTAPPNTTTQP